VLSVLYCQFLRAFLVPERVLQTRDEFVASTAVSPPMTLFVAFPRLTYRRDRR